MGESLKFKEYCNRTVPAQYSDQVFVGEISTTKIILLTLRGETHVFCVSCYVIFITTTPRVIILSTLYNFNILFTCFFHV